MSRRTAGVIFTDTETSASHSTTFTGSGLIDFPDSSLDLNLYVPLKGQSLPIEVIYTGGGLFETGHGITDHSVAGKSWVSIDLKDVLKTDPQSAGLFVSANPAALLPIYGSRNNLVRLVAPRASARSTNRTYAITLPTSSFQRELSLLPQSARDGLAGVSFKQMPTDLTIGPDDLIDQARIRFDLGSALSVDETLDFSQFGTPLSVNPPGPNVTMSIQQFMAASVDETSNSLQKQLLTPADIGAGTESVTPAPAAEGDCFDPRSLLNSSGTDQSGVASEQLEEPLKNGEDLTALDEIAAYPHSQSQLQVFSEIVGQLDACKREEGFIKGTDVTIPLEVRPLSLSTDSDTQLAPFDFDISKSYEQVATYPDGSHSYTDLTIFMQGEKIAVVSFGQLGATNASYFLSLADSASRRMTP